MATKPTKKTTKKATPTPKAAKAGAPARKPDEKRPKAAKTAQKANGGGKDKAKGEPRSSGLSGAYRVLKEAGKPLNCKAMVGMMLDKGYWKTEGKTPWATLYSAILREITLKKTDSRFKKAGRGLFALSGKGGDA